MAGAVLMFVLWPIALNGLWWLACGVDASELVRSTAELAGMHFVLVAGGLACAALTGGFPRFVLWGLVMLVVWAMPQLFFAGGGALGLSRLAASALCGSLVALAIAGHQFATRNLRRSLVMAVAGVLLAGATSVAWRRNFMESSQPSPEPHARRSTDLDVKISGAAPSEGSAAFRPVAGAD